MITRRIKVKEKHSLMNLKLHIFKSIILLILTTIFVNIKASDLENNYADYHGVINQLHYEYTIDIVDDSLVVTQTNTKEVQLTNHNTKGFTKDYIFFSSFTSISDIDAYSLVPEGNGFNKFKVDQFQETHSTDGGIFYDDSKTLQFSYPSLESGSKTYLKYTINYKNPRFLRTCYFQSFLPVAHSKVTVKVHRDIDIGYKLFNEDVTPISFNEYKKGKYYYYEWEVKDVKPYHYQSGKYYSVSHFSPHIQLYIKQTNINNNISKYFGTPGLLYNFYYDFVKNVNKDISEELVNKVNEITNGLNDTEKAKTIYYWIHQNIKYVAYEQGYAGFIPTEASEVFAKRYGDCKGMSSLIKAMMEIAGLPTYFTWVGTRHIPYTYEESPLPSTDNHMIATQLINDSLIIFDGTFKYLDYGIYPYHIQGKEILIGKGLNDFEVISVPVSPSSYSVINDSTTIRMKEGQILGKGKVTYSGFNKVELAYTMDGVKTDNYLKTYSRIFNKGNNKFKVTKEQTFNLFKYEVPAEVNYEFEINDYCKSYNDEIYINLNLDKVYQGMIIDTLVTITPIQNDFHCTKKFVTKFIIPEGYEVTYIPKNSSYEGNDFIFSMNYHKEKNSIVLDNEYTLNFLILLENRIPEWNDMIKKLNKNYRKTLVLKKIQNNL